MELHRVRSQADWLAVAPADRTKVQRLAARTAGIVTPANLISVFGFGVSMTGLGIVYNGGYFLGAVLLALGRVADIADGAAAHYTGTKSSVGEAVDATIDKIIALTAFIVMAVTGLVPALLLWPLVGLTIWIAALSLYAKLIRHTVHPSAAGKGATLLLWVGLLAYIWAGACTPESSEYIVSVLIANAALAGALVRGTVAAVQYGRELHMSQASRHGK